MKKFIDLISDKKFLFAAMALMLFCMLCCTISLNNRLETAEKKKEDLEKLLAIYQEDLHNSEDQVILHTATIIELQDTIYAKNIELENAIASSNATLFDEHFSNIDFSDGLSYVEIWELNKQYSLSTNTVSLDSIGKQLELNKTLIELTHDALQAENDDTKKLVLQSLIDGLKEEYDWMLPIYDQLVKNSKDLEDYDVNIPMPIPIN